MMEALAAAQKGDYAKAEELVEAANACIVEAHHAQTSLLQKEAAGEDLAFSVTLMHGQDHLMTTLLLKDMMSHMIELYKRGDK
ncbi:PTS lactose transporter subunit IIA [Enterococcus cecorum DSM 20682 = ATCC 43198]|nr:PTS lactose transporter subunit IIA [Enterococcus cecorum DSM 20682 = ATCC 43198]